MVAAAMAGIQEEADPGGSCPALFMNASTMLVKREAQSGKGVDLIFVCEIRNALHEIRVSAQPNKLIFKASTSYPRPISTIAGSGSSNSVTGVTVAWPGGAY
jgi:hypothetical protein